MMDTLGLVEAVIALAVYPGGLFLALTASAVRRGAGLRGGARGIPASGMAALVACGFAASLAPLPASPATVLPPVAGAAPNLVVASILLAAGVALAARGGWDSRRLFAGGVAVVSLASLAAATTTLALPSIDAAPGTTLAAARAATAAALLLAAPFFCRTFGAGPPAVRAGLTATAAILAFSLVTPAQLTGGAAALASLAVFAATTLYAFVLRLLARFIRAEHRGVLTLAAAAGAIAVAAVAVAGR
ncbi:MAG TPA: hypothetical protein VNY76_01860 [Candidatus Acidoferrales bacterium]|nr:hypothetical protein [Candidatus Acidoferrales bacterium]